jgi:hypothetical protein
VTESWNEFEGLAELEAAVRAAGEYVRPSDELRPRVLETARLEGGERRARRRIGRFGLAMVAAILLLQSGGGPVERVLGRPTEARLWLSADDLYVVAESRMLRRGVDLGWGMVDAFSDLRARQAKALRPAM